MEINIILHILKMEDTEWKTQMGDTGARVSNVVLILPVQFETPPAWCWEPGCTVSRGDSSPLKNRALADCKD